MVNNRKREKTSRSSSDKTAQTLLKSTEFLNLLKSAITEAVSAVLEGFKVDLHKSIMEMNTKMRDLEELVAFQQKRLESVEATMKEVKEKKEDPAEIKERHRSIVAIGVPESTCSSMFERSAADINAVHELFKCVDATSPPITVYRLGRQREDGFLHRAFGEDNNRSTLTDFVLFRFFKMLEICGKGVMD
uniref:Uncharacterized protein n=1 Tax=Caenorhabditis japonica TaxID=281687 RepID=A0A8R1I987_CAEJA